MKNFIILLLFLFLGLISCRNNKNDSNLEKSGNFKVGLVFDVGGRGDKSFNDAAYKGLEKAKNELGIDFEVIDPGDGSDRESALRKLASQPEIYIIFGVGFIFTEDITKISRDFPNKKFACIDYSVNQEIQIPENLLALQFKEEEGSFLVGALAALKSKSGIIGFVGGMESALIRKFESGYEQGAKYINPDIKIFKAYVGITGEGFKNPGKAEEIALSQYNNGADIIYHASGLSGIGVFKAAKEQNKLAIGVDMDQYNEAPGFVLTSMVKKVDEMIFQTIKDFKENQFKGGVKLLGLKEKGVGYVYDDNNKNLISPDFQKRLNEISEKIINNEIKIKVD